MINFEVSARETKYMALSNLYAITHAPNVVDQIFDEFTTDEILSYEDNAGIIYLTIKKFPSAFNGASEEKQVYLLNELKDEYRQSSGLTEIVTTIINNMNEDNLLSYRKDVVELVDIAIKHMRAQGFEIVPYVITSMDIMDMLDKLEKLLLNMDMSSGRSFLREITTKYNFSYLIDNLSSVIQTPLNPSYKELIEYYREIIDEVEGYEDDNVDYEDEDYNPLRDLSMTNEEMVRLAYNSINFTLQDLDKESQMRCIVDIRNIMSSYQVNDDEKEIFKICMRILEPFLIDIKKTYELVEARDESFITVFKDIVEIGELEYRIPRLMYLTSGRFEIHEPIYDPVFINELKVMKDLQICEHLHSSYMEAQALADPSYVYIPHLSIDIEKVSKLVPIKYDEEDTYDSILSENAQFNN